MKPPPFFNNSATKQTLLHRILGCKTIFFPRLILKFEDKPLPIYSLIRAN